VQKIQLWKTEATKYSWIMNQDKDMMNSAYKTLYRACP